MARRKRKEKKERWTKREKQRITYVKIWISKWKEEAKKSKQSVKKKEEVKEERLSKIKIAIWLERETGFENGR